jgi:SAM-dependent methyltransferase
MEFTGERMVPEKADKHTFWEHIYRYRFAARFVNGRQVLDVACGEGYGTAALAKAGAAKVVGVDISPETCSYAAKKYGIETRVGNGENLPVESSSVDVVVSFETIEHVPNPKAFLDECQRILRPNGLLVISTPNHEAARICQPNNPFHCSELTVAEFKKLIEDRFTVQGYYSQRPFRVAWWNLRGLSAITWPVRKIRGIERLIECSRRVLCPHLTEKGTDSFRSEPLAAIQMNQRAFTSLIDTFAIRKFAPACVETPLIVIAVAIRT